MRPRTLVFITMLALCHPQVDGQAFTNALPPPQPVVNASFGTTGESFDSAPSNLPDDPGQEILPVARPEPQPPAGTPVEWQAQHQEWAGDVATLTGNVVFHYRGYVLRADKVTYNRVTTQIRADGHLQLTGGPNDMLVHATHGEMRLDTHTARLYDVTGSQGVRTFGRTIVYSTPNPLIFTARLLLETGEGQYRLIDGTITNCRLPHPDWQLIAHSIALNQNEASMKNSYFKLLGVPLVYLPYLKHSTTGASRISGLLTPVVGTDSIRGYIFGDQVYWAINRSTDMVLGMEYFSKRGWAPNGDFRYRGLGRDHLISHWSALIDRGATEVTSTGTQKINQGGVDISVEGIKELSPYTRFAGVAEYLSSYVYRLVFDENYTQATSSQVSSNVAYTHARNGLVPSVAFERFQNFASTVNGDEIRLLHLPSLRYDVLDRPLGRHLEWGLGSSLNYLSRSEPDFHARNVGRLDVYPYLALPLTGGGWSVLAEGAFRSTSYTISMTPDLTGANNFIPTISHDPVHRIDAEAQVDIRPPVLERDYHLGFVGRDLRHVIEPELTYRVVDGIGPKARNVLLFDTTDIVTDTNELDYSLTQRFFLRNTRPAACAPNTGAAGNAAAKPCRPAPREWASWQIAQKFFIDPTFGGAVIPHRRNVFATTLDLTGADFLTDPRNLSPVVSRMRFEAVNNLRVEWDMDYDPKRGQMDADDLFAGYSFGRTTVGITHALLNAFDELPSNGTRGGRTLKSQIVAPFLQIGKQSRAGFNLAVNGGYDAAEHTIQYAGVQAVYNWDCCGLTVGYRRFQLGSVGAVSRDETQWLYSFTLANFGSVGDVRRSTSVFRDTTLPPAY